MTNSKRIFITDVKNRMLLSLKLMLSNKLTLSVFILSLISTFFLLQILNEGAEVNSNIPIGIVNEDILNETNTPSELSLELIEGLGSVEALFLHTGTFDELYLKLLEGHIFALFVINEDYEINIEKSDFKNIITVYQGSESKVAKLLQDIVAGEMLYRICLSRGIRLYSNLREGDAKKFSDAEYKEYSDSIKDSEAFDFTFDTQFVNKNESNFTEEMLNNKLLYRQIIGAIFAMILSFVILFAGTYLPLEKAQGLSLRMKLSRMNQLASALGNLVAILLLTFILCITFCGLISFYVKDWSIFIPVLLASCGYVIIVTLIILLLGKCTKSIFVYQLLGAVLVLLLGAGGMLSIVNDMVQVSDQFVRILPNSWFIKTIADIIIF